MQSKIKVTTAAILLSVFGMSSGANAAEMTIQNVVDNVVAKAVTITAQEISNGVYNAIANAGHHISLGNEEYNTKVLISKTDKHQEVTQETAE